MKLLAVSLMSTHINVDGSCIEIFGIINDED